MEYKDKIYEPAAVKIRIGPDGKWKNKGPLFMIPCEFCGSATGLKYKSQIGYQLKGSGGIYCKASCKRHESIPKVCEICGNAIVNSCKKNGKWSRFCSKGCYSNWQRTEENANENHPNWKGGYEGRERYDQRIRAWRKSVFERDDYICQECGERGKVIQAHHIACWSEYPEQRFDMDNGITLCKYHHKWVHSKKKMWAVAILEVIKPTQKISNIELV